MHQKYWHATVCMNVLTHWCGICSDHGFVALGTGLHRADVDDLVLYVPPATKAPPPPPLTGERPLVSPHITPSHPSEVQYNNYDARGTAHTVL